jgi:hypothetical protein
MKKKKLESKLVLKKMSVSNLATVKGGAVSKPECQTLHHSCGVK